MPLSLRRLENKALSEVDKLVKLGFSLRSMESTSCTIAMNDFALCKAVSGRKDNDEAYRLGKQSIRKEISNTDNGYGVVKMSITSLTFIGVFFPLLLIAYYNPIFKNNSFRKFILLCASIGLYTFCEPIYALLLIGIIIINFLLVKAADKYHHGFFRAFAIIIDAGVLLFFKYINILLAKGLFNGKISSFVFPLGLSYFIFKTISYVVDSKEHQEGTIVDVAIYISNFLTIVSGPLSTYSDELPSIKIKRQPSFDLAYKGIERLILGFAKKVIIADSLGVLATQCFASTEISFVMSWAGAVAYTLQIFFDFAGYTDMAIGIGYLFGFSLPENFNYPYMAKSISDFWKRWHISLTKWFTKYIYIPLGGSRVKTAARHIFNLFVVWFVTGIWHGSNITFIIWAMIYFVLQTLEKYTKLADHINKIHLGRVYTLLVVIIEWVIFRSTSVTTGFSYIKSMFLLNANSFIAADDLSIILKYSIPFVLGLIFATNLGIKIKSFFSKNEFLNCVYNFGLILLFVLCIIVSMSQGYVTPLYAGF